MTRPSAVRVIRDSSIRVGEVRTSIPSRLWRLRPLYSTAVLVLVPSWIVVLVVYMAAIVWSAQISLTDSKLLPGGHYIGFRHYVRLFHMARWILSLQNLMLFGTLFIAGCLVVGFLLAAALDQKVRFESAFRTAFLFPQAMSFVVTGLVWQWLMNPLYGIQQTVRALGLPAFSFAWAVDRHLAIYAVVVAGIWQASGVVMVLMLAGLRNVSPEIWHAARVDGIPVWRVYVSVIIPDMWPLAVTAVVLLSIAVIKVYELVVALTDGGPGIASEVPAKFVMDYMFSRQNIGLATAASTLMLLTVLAVAAPWAYFRYLRKSVRPRLAEGVSS